jgi:hypothetical protein
MKTQPLVAHKLTKRQYPNIVKDTGDVSDEPTLQLLLS